MLSSWACVGALTTEASGAVTYMTGLGERWLPSEKVGTDDPPEFSKWLNHTLPPDTRSGSPSPLTSAMYSVVRDLVVCLSQPS